MRRLAPIPTPKTTMPLLRKAIAQGCMFEYRMTEQSKKHLAVDLFSVGILVKVLEAVNETNRAKILAMAPNVGRMAMFALEAMKGKKRG